MLPRWSSHILLTYPLSLDKCNVSWLSGVSWYTPSSPFAIHTFCFLSSNRLPGEVTAISTFRTVNRWSLMSSLHNTFPDTHISPFFRSMKELMLLSSVSPVSSNLASGVKLSVAGSYIWIPIYVPISKWPLLSSKTVRTKLWANECSLLGSCLYMVNLAPS